ncbi:aminoacyl-histidine dipeptidase, partial [Streptococcus pyogenes]
MQIASLSGGSRDNVIPSAATANLVVEDEVVARAAVDAVVKDLKKELFTADPGLTVEVASADIVEVYSKDLTQRLLNFFTLLPNG